MKITIISDSNMRSFKCEPEDELEAFVLSEMASFSDKGMTARISKLDTPMFSIEMRIKKFNETPVREIDNGYRDISQ